MATLYVNQAWTSLSNGEKVTVDGIEYTFGTDAFASFTAALQNISAATKEIVISGTITEAGPVSNTTITLSQDLKISGGNVTWTSLGGWVYFTNAEDVDATLTFDGVTFNGTAAKKAVFFGTDTVVDSDSKIEFYNSKIQPDATVQVLAGGQFNSYPEALNIDGNLSVKGNDSFEAAEAELADRQTFIQYSQNIYGNVDLEDTYFASFQRIDLKDSATLSADNALLEFGVGSDGAWNGNPVPNGYGDLNISGTDAVVDLTNGSILKASADVTNNGTINVNGSTLIANGTVASDGDVPENRNTGVFTNNGTISVSGESTLNIRQLAGDGSIELEDGAVITDSTIGGGTVALQGTATFKGVNSIGTLSVSGYNHNLIIGTDGSLKANGGRTTLSYGSTIDVDGTIENAKTADKANLTKSLEITGGFSFNGNGTYNGVDATLNVDNAYVSFGSSTSKNSGATGNFVFNFTNSIVDFTADFQTAASTVNTLDPYFSLNVKDSVFSIGTRFAFSHKNSTAVIDNSLFSTAAQFKNVGEFTLQNGSVMTVGSNADGPSYEKTGNFGTLNIIDSVFDFSAAATSAAYAFYNAGTVYVDGGEFYSDYVKNEGSFVVTDEGTVEVKSFTNNGTISISGESTLKTQQLASTNGTVTVTGSSKLEIGNFTGVMSVEDATILDGSSIGGAGSFEGADYIEFTGGSVAIEGDVNIQPRIETYTDVTVSGGTFTGSWICLCETESSFVIDSTATVNCSDFWSSVAAPAYAKIDGDLNASHNIWLHNADIYGNVEVGNQLLIYSNDAFNLYGSLRLNGNGSPVGFLVGNPNNSTGYYAGDVTVNVIGGSVEIYGTSYGQEIIVADNGILNVKKDEEGTRSQISVNGIITNRGEMVIDGGTLSSNYQIVNNATGTLYLGDAQVTVTYAPAADGKGSISNDGEMILTEKASISVGSISNKGTITIDVAEGWTGVKVLIDARNGSTFGNVVLAEEDALAGVQYRVDSENGDLIVYNVDANTLYVDADYTGAFGEDLGDGKYFGINAFANLNDAVAAAADGNTLQLSGTISGSAAFANGKDLTITGEAEFSWADGWFFVGRGADDAVDTTVTFRDAVISEDKEYAWNIGTGFNVAQSEGEGSGKANGTLNIENSKIITTYLANRNIVNVKGDGIEDGVYGYNGKANLTVLNGFYVSRDNDDELNAEMNLTDGAYVRVEWENAMGIGYGDGRGVLNITDSKFEAAGDQVLTNPGDLTVETNGAINVTNGELTVQNNLRNNGSINIAGSKLTAASVSGTGSFTIGAGASELNIGSLQQNVYANQNSDEAILLTGSVNTSNAISVYGDATLDDLSVNGDYVGALVSGTGKVYVFGDTLITGNTVMNLNAFQTTNSGVIDKDVVINTANFNAYDMGAAKDGTVVDAQFVIKGTLNTVSFIVTNDLYSAGGEDELIVAEDAVLNVTYQSSNGRYSLQTGKVTIYGYANANLSSGGGSSNFGSGAGYAMNLTIDGTYAAEDNNNGKFIKVGTQNLVIKEESSVNLVNGAQFQWQGGVVTNDAQINIVNSSFEATKLVNNGIVAVDLSSAEPYQFKVDTLVNNGTLSFTFDAGMEIEGGMMLLVDANSATEYGEVIFNGISDDYDAVVIDGDLYAFDTKKIYVNAAYASYSAGDEIAEGIYFGINAFASLETIDADLTEAARTIEFTYNGSEAMEITVTSAGSSILTYDFEGQSASFISGSRTHTISEEGVYTFDFAKGDFELATRIFELNESEEITGDNIADEEVVVNEYAGNKEYTFEVGANTTGKLTCTYEDVDGTVRAQVFDANGNVVREKLFNRDGSFVVADLEEGSYKVVFSGYGSNPDAEFTTSFEYVETAIADFTKDDTLEGSNVFSYLAGLEVEDKVGGEDSVDWFRIEDIEGGSYNLSFDTEGGDGLQVALYNEIDGVSKSISTFFVNDKNVDAADYIRKAKVAADADLLIKVSGRGDETKYAITFNPVV